MAINHRSFGAILRVYTKDPELVSARAEQAVEAAINLAKIAVDGKKFFKRIDILVAADPDFIDCDCGKTAKVVRARLHGRDDDEIIFTTEVKHGDLFCGLLNYGVAHQVRTAKIDYSCVVSPEAVSYATARVMKDILKAALDHAKVIDVAFGELSPSIHEGRLANTFCFWHNESLQTVGGFDLQASALEKDDRQAVYLRGWKKDEGDVFYARSGVEEIIPLVKLIKEYGKCLAVVEADQGEWKIPDPKVDPVAYDRHCKKMGTKLERQSAFAFAVGADLSYLKGGLMK